MHDRMCRSLKAQEGSYPRLYAGEVELARNTGCGLEQELKESKSGSEESLRKIPARSFQDRLEDDYPELEEEGER